MPKSTLAEANAKKDWHIYQDFGYILMQKTKKLYRRTTQTGNLLYGQNFSGQQRFDFLK